LFEAKTSAALLFFAADAQQSIIPQCLSASDSLPRRMPETNGLPSCLPAAGAFQAKIFIYISSD